MLGDQLNAAQTATVAASDAVARSNLRRVVFQQFTQHGFTVQAPALRYLETLIMDEVGIPQDRWVQVLSYICEQYREHEASTTSFVEREALERVVQAVMRDNALLRHGSAASARMAAPAQLRNQLDARTKLMVMDAFETAKWKFDPSRKSIYRDSKTKPSLIASLEERSAAFLERYELVKQRTLRHELFSKSAHIDDQAIQLSSISSLLGATEYKYLLGLLSQLEEGTYSLEDSERAVALDLTAAEKVDGLYTEGSMILVEGDYRDGVFHARVIGFPPAEKRDQTIAAHGASNLVTVGDDDFVVKELEREATESMFICLSDVWLDNPQVMAKLRVLFSGYADLDASWLVFVLMGHFSSKPWSFHPNDSNRYRDLFNQLADMISEVAPNIASQSHFVFVPGPHDPIPDSCLPRAALPAELTKRLKTKLPHSHFVSNPCRIKFCSQEIVIMRADWINKLHRNCVLAPNADVDLPRHLLRTLIDNAHLSPLSLTVQPIYWSFDYALRLYPTPHVLILGDKYEAYNVSYNGCLAANPGSFACNDFNFCVYMPSEGTFETSVIP